jgi:hypothetical protein
VGGHFSAESMQEPTTPAETLTVVRHAFGRSTSAITAAEVAARRPQS